MFSFKTLGALELRSSSGVEQSAVGGQKLVALLTYLAVAKPRGLHRRDTLVGLLWPELDQERARAALRHSVYRLRRSLGPDAIVSRGDEDIGIDLQVVRCDAAIFEDLLDAGDVAAALEVYDGDLLPGFFVSGVPEFEQWLDRERAQLRERASASAWQHAVSRGEQGDRDGAAHWARRAVALAPDDEQLLRRVLSLLVESGDTAGALRAYEAFARRLSSEYNAAPAAETTAIVDKLRYPVDRGREPVRRAASAATVVTLGAGELPAPSAEQQTALVSPPSDAMGAPRAAWTGTSRMLVAVVALAAIVSAIVIGRGMRSSDPGVSPTVAVLPFEVHGNPDLEYLSQGMSDLLSIGLDGIGGLRSADPRLVLTASRREGPDPNDPRISQKVADRIGARLYVTGTVVEAGGRLALTATLHDRNGRVRTTARTGTAEIARLFDLVDELARQLMAGGIDGAPNEVVRLAARTTSSVPALRAFLDGERAIRAGRHAAALEAFQQAVTEDSTFALAYYRLGAAGRWLTEYRLANDAADKAARYGNSLPSYARRLLVASQAIRRGDYAQAESLYRAGIASRPGDVDAWFGLGDLFYHYNALRGRSRGEGRNAFEQALAIDPEDGQSRLHLLELMTWEGNVVKVDSLLAGLDEGSDFASKWPFVRALITRDSVTEARLATDLRQLNDRALVRVVIHSASTFPSNLVGATRVLDLLTEPARSNGWRAYGYQLRASVELARGRWEASRTDLTTMGALEPAAATEYGALFSVAPFIPVDRDAVSALRAALAAWDAAPTPPSGNSVFAMHDGMHPQLRFYLLGLVSIRLGDTTAALRYADSIMTIPVDSARALIARNLATGVLARVTRARGDLRGALAQLGQPWLDPRTHGSHRSSILSQVSERYLRAELLRETGRLAEAINAYGAVGDYAVDGLMYMGPSHFRRGEIYAQMGDREKATAHYRRFLELWRDCDPALRPMRDTAERRLSELTRR